MFIRSILSSYVQTNSPYHQHKKNTKSRNENMQLDIAAQRIKVPVSSNRIMENSTNIDVMKPGSCARKLICQTGCRSLQPMNKQ